MRLSQLQKSQKQAEERCPPRVTENTQLALRNNYLQKAHFFLVLPPFKLLWFEFYNLVECLIIPGTR
jgi:hypothetical protein